MSDGTDGWLVSWAIFLTAGIYIDGWKGVILVIFAVICILATWGSR